MNWPTMRPTLKSIVESVLGFSANDGHVEWKGTAQAGMARPGARVDMSIRSSSMIGVDEGRRQEDDSIIICGARQFNWTLRFETDDQSDDGIAQLYADRFVVRLGRQSSTDALNAAGMAWASALPTQTVDYKSQDRMHSVVVVELVMNGVENDVDDTVGSGDWIAEVDYASDSLVGTDGNPSSIQITEVVRRAS